MIDSVEVSRKSNRVLAQYEKLVKDGTATPEQRERYATILDHVLIYEWAENSRPAVEVIPPAPVDPVVLQFCDWYMRARRLSPWRATDVTTALLWWWGPKGRETLAEEIEAGVMEELGRRDAINREVAA